MCRMCLQMPANAGVFYFEILINEWLSVTHIYHSRAGGNLIQRTHTKIPACAGMAKSWVISELLCEDCLRTKQSSFESK